ncbi:hypothetical protein B9Z55_025291 [Caenorhabditis nigoni]|uniref:Uncharacterized protein n=1 Tax=Caenorhabditis nigoni TaxID=1611254 RepID=A0A2G5SY79_9PELO|nr:hypothetical protein B9Z55_025291 [Caenorhabditis nigoni]
MNELIHEKGPNPLTKANIITGITNRKRKQNGEQEQPQEPEQNQSPQIDHQKPVQTPPEEPKSELQQDQPEQPQEARS